MRRSSILSSKIAKLEKRTGINKPPQIPAKDRMHLIQGATQKEIQDKEDRIKAEIVQKYGQWALPQLQFLIILMGHMGATERSDSAGNKGSETG